MRVLYKYFLPIISNDGKVCPPTPDFMRLILVSTKSFLFFNIKNKKQNKQKTKKNKKKKKL